MKTSPTHCRKVLNFPYHPLGIRLIFTREKEDICCSEGCILVCCFGIYLSSACVVSYPEYFLLDILPMKIYASV